MESNFTKTFNPNDQRLVAPDNMIVTIMDCLETPVMPLTDVIISVYHSLAKSYACVVDEIEIITGEKVEVINIVGGSFNDECYILGNEF